LGILKALDLWPNDYGSLFKTAEKIDEVPEQFVSFDCFIDKRTSDSEDQNELSLYFYRLVCINTITLILLVVILLLFDIWKIVKRVKN
jgi:hypothetical protein